MSFSVVIPNFNHGHLLPRVVGAVMAQQPRPLEIFIINDGSTDNSLSVIKSLQARFGCVRLIQHNRNRGVIAGLNEGLHAAMGEFVYFAAADDFSFPGLFAVAESSLCSHPKAAFFCARVAVVSPEGKVLGYRPFMQPSSRAAFLGPAAVRKLLLRSDNWCVGQAVIFRRARLVDAGGFNTIMGAFTDGLVVRSLALNHGFCFDPRLLAAWQISPTSFSARSALSISENSRVVAASIREVRSSFPVDMRDDYADRLGRRLRFNMARLWLVFHKGSIDPAGLAEVVQFGGFRRKILELLARLPFARTLVLLWMSVVLHPYGLNAVITGCFRALKARILDRKAVESLIADVRKTPAEGDGERAKL